MPRLYEQIARDNKFKKKNCSKLKKIELLQIFFFHFVAVSYFLQIVLEMGTYVVITRHVGVFYWWLTHSINEYLLFPHGMSSFCHFGVIHSVKLGYDKNIVLFESYCVKNHVFYGRVDLFDVEWSNSYLYIHN